MHVARTKRHDCACQVLLRAFLCMDLHEIGTSVSIKGLFKYHVICQGGGASQMLPFVHEGGRGYSK